MTQPNDYAFEIAKALPLDLLERLHKITFDALEAGHTLADFERHFERAINLQMATDNPTAKQELTAPLREWRERRHQREQLYADMGRQGLGHGAAWQPLPPLPGHNVEKQREQTGAHLAAMLSSPDAVKALRAHIDVFAPSSAVASEANHGASSPASACAASRPPAHSSRQQILQRVRGLLRRICPWASPVRSSLPDSIKGRQS